MTSLRNSKKRIIYCLSHVWRGFFSSYVLYLYFMIQWTLKVLIKYSNEDYVSFYVDVCGGTLLPRHISNAWKCFNGKSECSVQKCLQLLKHFALYFLIHLNCKWDYFRYPNHFLQVMSILLSIPNNVKHHLHVCCSPAEGNIQSSFTIRGKQHIAHSADAQSKSRNHREGEQVQCDDAEIWW